SRQASGVANESMVGWTPGDEQMQRVRHFLRGMEPLRHFARTRLREPPIHFGGERRVDAGGHGQGITTDSDGEAPDRLRIERLLPGHTLERHYAQRPEIGPVIDTFR